MTQLTSSATGANGTPPLTSPLRARGHLARLTSTERAALLERATSADPAIRARTAAIVERVRTDGDAALRALALELDGVRLDALEIPRARWTAALDRLEPALRRAMERAAGNIARSHEAGRPVASEIETEPGVVVGRRPDPLERVGVYAPGGRAAYPSSVLMGVVPARVAGVREIILCSPPDSRGVPAEVVLAAAALAGADRVFALGGAGAVAAMAHGTESVPRVDRIVGPGNAYVAEAKLQLSGVVAIDAPAGPSELLIVADAAADAATLAREMLAQAEHDPLAAAVAVVTDAALAERLERALAERLASEPRRETIARSLAARGAVLVAGDLAQAVEFAASYAPEHLLLAVRDPGSLLPAVRNAGTVFLGESSLVAFGDYITGANHVLPTGGLARSYSGLSTADFVRWTTYQRLTPAAAAGLAGDTARLAEAEGLPAHAAAARAVALRSPLARAAYAAIPLYASGAAERCDVDLSDNTNLWGVPPAAARALSELGTRAARYPASYSPALAEAIARHVGVEPEMVVTGCGSDDVLDAAMRAVADAGARVAHPDPSFSMIPVFARTNGLSPLPVPLAPTFHLDVEGLLRAGARVTYVCSPNNPTGTLASRAAIERVVAGAPGLVIADEAYAEFAGTSVLDLVATSERLLVTRTFSKAFGLAGLRVGYAIGAPALVAEVARARGPYKVSVAAERAATAALAHDLAWVEERVAEVRENRSRFATALAALPGGFKPLPSSANFVLVALESGRSASAVAAALAARGVAVRAFPSLPLLGDALRITIGPWWMMERCLGALEALAAPSGEAACA